jgi:hypothetical protein
MIWISPVSFSFVAGLDRINRVKLSHERVGESSVWVGQ